MTGMDETIEQVGEIVDGILSADPQIVRWMDGDESDRIARALHAAGLLAPAPLREETTGALTSEQSRTGAKGTVTHRRWVTAWVPADRAEGDGSAEQ